MRVLRRKTITDPQGKTMLSPVWMNCSECKESVQRVVIFEEEDNIIWLCKDCLSKAIQQLHGSKSTH